MEPFGRGNPEPVLKASPVTVIATRRMGSDGQHVRLTLRDVNSLTMQMVAFNASEAFVRDVGDTVRVWFQPMLNEWNGSRSVEGRLLYLEKI